MYLLVWVGSGACNSKGWAGTVDETFGSRIFIVSLEATFSVQLAESVTLEHVTHCRGTRSCYWSFSIFAGRPIYVIRKKIFCKSCLLVYIWNLWHFAAWPTAEMNILIVFAAPLTSLTCDHDCILLLICFDFCYKYLSNFFAFESQLQHFCSYV